MKKYRLRFYIDILLIAVLLTGSVLSSVYSGQIRGLISSHSLWTVLFIALQTVNLILIIGLVLRAGKMGRLSRRERKRRSGIIVGEGER